MQNVNPLCLNDQDKLNIIKEGFNNIKFNINDGSSKISDCSKEFKE